MATSNLHILRILILSFFIIFSYEFALSQIVNVGDGSYTTTFPGVDEAGRNTFPSGTPFTVGQAADRPAPTNDWWSAKIKNSHADNLFSYPYTLKTTNNGLVVTYIPWGVIDDVSPITVGVTGLNASAANVSDFSDWTVSMDWSNAGHNFQTTAGIGMPFIYFTKNTTDVAQLNITQGSVTIDEEMLVIVDARNGADFAVYAPEGSVWTQNGTTYTSTLNGENYWSMAFIPLDAADVDVVANEYKKYAYVFPLNTRADYNYDKETAVVRTNFVIETEVKEGSSTNMLLGLLPHQWDNLASDSPVPEEYSYSTVRGELKTLEGNSFSVENTFYGILPTLPYLDFLSEGFNPQTLNEKVQLLENDGLATWTDSYNEGQMMNRLIQTARIADLMGNVEARDKMLLTIKERLEDWLSVNAGEVAFLFYYHQSWSALLGYPAGHGQDGNINDHHFHWGYFIHAAAFMEQFEPGWASQWGEMIDLLVRDAASDNREDELFPYLRNFSPYAGHCWANGFASFPQGNDQESTSESMQFNSSLIHWGTITGNDAVRDLGIYLYTTEQSAIEEYWLDMEDRNFGPSQQYSLVSRVWGNSYDNGTFWTNDIAASYGIELYPIHGGSLYLGQNIDYVDQLWAEIEDNTGILNNEANANLWHDVMWEYLAFTDPAYALELYDSYPDRELKFGVSDAQTYHWLHAMNALGQVETAVTADCPLAAVFNDDGELTYVAHNYEDTAVDVTFSDGYVLNVPANSMATSRDIALAGILSSSFSAAYPGGSVTLNLLITEGTPSRVEFFDGDNLLGEITEAPFVFNATDLALGIHNFYAKIYDGDDFIPSNTISVQVGEQVPYSGTPAVIPGAFLSAHYDKYEGGIGQGIAYQDVSPGNNGDFRTEESVDALIDPTEGGATVGWISSGEWLEYTVDVAQAGYYTLELRYASGNSGGGGPVYLQKDGENLSTAIIFNATNDWDNWQTKTVNNIPLSSGEQVLRLFFEEGEFNLGNLTFSYESPLDFDQPIADAGENILVVLPENSTTLDGSNSSDPEGAELNYSWVQLYGPSVLMFSDAEVATPTVTGLIEGVYKIQLRLDNGSYTDLDEVYIISSNSEDVAPNISITNPQDGDEYLEGETININAVATDIVGSVAEVTFFVDGEIIGTLTEAPYSVTWEAELEGTYSISATATDDGGLSGVSETIEITVKPAPSCIGTSYNGDFDYQFSEDDNNPTLTFIPSEPGVGTPTCILYYGTNANSLPGYGVTPNVPFPLNASEGTTIYFYYTYSYPGEIERNNADHKDTYVVGSCRLTSLEDYVSEATINYYPNPVSGSLTMELGNGKNEISVYSLSGRLLNQLTVSEAVFEYDMEALPAGVYLFKILNGNSISTFRVVK